MCRRALSRPGLSRRAGRAALFVSTDGEGGMQRSKARRRAAGCCAGREGPMKNDGNAAPPPPGIAPMTLPAPQVVACYFDVGFVPPLASMQLAWPPGAEGGRRRWTLPNGETLEGPPPARFG